MDRRLLQRTVELDDRHRRMHRPVRGFVDADVCCRAQELDENEAFALDLFQAMAGLSLGGTGVPAEMGGTGSDCVGYDVLDAAVAPISDMVQIHGGIGFIRGVEVERLYREARICRIHEGANEIQRMIIARELLK